MDMVVVPAKDEEGRIHKVLKTLQKSFVQKIIVVVNGSSDNTMREIKALKMPQTEILFFRQGLGIDVPRAVGAFHAFKTGAKTVAFVDGDMIGNIASHVNDLIYSVKKGTDLALTNCYPVITYSNALTEQILLFRALLNVNLGIYNVIGVASPSHGPHAVSRKLLELIDFKYFGVPPLVLSFAVKNKLTVKVSTTIPQSQLGSTLRDHIHASKICDTIIGDTLEALNYFFDKPKSRRYLYREFQGYNPERRFDILENIICRGVI
ncbi:MAG: glycosyltransferase family 2 protein [Thermoanaerobacterales bacterium]|nr:glycosyltransferase family 2 protein [Thermoanaerobacterales bacterium]